VPSGLQILRQRPPEITIHTRNEDFHVPTSFVIWSFTSGSRTLKNDHFKE
jgi:hypothetical protein